MSPTLHHLAQATPDLLPEDFGTATTQNYEYIYNLLVHAGSLATKLVFAVALVALLLTGFSLVTSLGDEAKVTKAKTSFLYIVLGILFVLGAYLVVTTIAPYFVGGLTNLPE